MSWGSESPSTHQSLPKSNLPHQAQILNVSSSCTVEFAHNSLITPAPDGISEALVNSCSARWFNCLGCICFRIGDSAGNCSLLSWVPEITAPGFLESGIWATIILGGPWTRVSGKPVSEKRLANPCCSAKMSKITKGIQAGRGKAPQWEIPIHVKCYAPECHASETSPPNWLHAD